MDVFMMSNPPTAAEWAARCKKSEHYIAHTLGLGVLLCLACADAYARQRVETWQVNVRTEKLPCGHPTFYMCGQGACGFCAEIAEQVAAFRERILDYLRTQEPIWPERERAIRALP